MKKLILLLATALLFTTCNRGPYYPFNQDAKEFFIFKKGSWWLYENEQTHERDCLYIVNDDFLIKTEDENNHYHDLAFSYFSSKDSVFYGDATYNSGTNDTHISETIVYKNLGLNFSVSFPNVELDTIVEYYSVDTVCQLNTKVTYLGDVIYGEKTRIKSLDGVIFYSSIKKIWRERNIGMTKFYIKSNTMEYSYNLVDYNVIY